MRSKAEYDSQLGWIVRIEIWEEENRPFSVTIDQGPGNDVPRIGWVTLIDVENAVAMAKDLLTAAKACQEEKDNKKESEPLDRDECMKMLMEKAGGEFVQ